MISPFEVSLFVWRGLHQILPIVVKGFKRIELLFGGNCYGVHILRLQQNMHLA
jgi:hypothetical protein